MAKNQVLIDFENVQPQNLALLLKGDFEVLIFLGQNQARLPFELVHAVQQLGSRARYVQAGGSGKNALDFHLSYYLGGGDCPGP